MCLQFMDNFLLYIYGLDFGYPIDISISFTYYNVEKRYAFVFTVLMGFCFHRRHRDETIYLLQKWSQMKRRPVIALYPTTDV